MSRIFQLSTTTLCLTLAAVLSLAMASGPCTATDARAATAPSTANVAQQRQQTLDELDEVWVRGKRLSREISDVEDDLFKLYNKLNKNHEYDILCGFTWLGRDDMVMRRVCMPAFVADSRATYMSASPSVYLPGPSLVCGGYSGGGSLSVPTLAIAERTTSIRRQRLPLSGRLHRTCSKPAARPTQTT